MAPALGAGRFQSLLKLRGCCRPRLGHPFSLGPRGESACLPPPAGWERSLTAQLLGSESELQRHGENHFVKCQPGEEHRKCLLQGPRRGMRREGRQERHSQGHADGPWGQLGASYLWRFVAVTLSFGGTQAFTSAKTLAPQLEYGLSSPPVEYCLHSPLLRLGGEGRGGRPERLRTAALSPTCGPGMVRAPSPLRTGGEVPPFPALKIQRWSFGVVDQNTQSNIATRKLGGPRIKAL